MRECRRVWALAGEARPFSAIIRPDAFPEPGSMPERVNACCAPTDRQAPGAAGRDEPHPTGGWGAACEKVCGLPL